MTPWFAVASRGPPSHRAGRGSAAIIRDRPQRPDWKVSDISGNPGEFWSQRLFGLCRPPWSAELRLANAAAQTRMVSGGPFWPNQRELSRHLKYIALERIPEFESSHPSHAVRSPPLDFVLKLSNKERVSARSVVIASGARYRQLAVDGLCTL